MLSTTPVKDVVIHRISTGIHLSGSVLLILHVQQQQKQQTPGSKRNTPPRNVICTQLIHARMQVLLTHIMRVLLLYVYTHVIFIIRM